MPTKPAERRGAEGGGKNKREKEMTRFIWHTHTHTWKNAAIGTNNTFLERHKLSVLFRKLCEIFFFLGGGD